jgi:hypothetical protein
MTHPRDARSLAASLASLASLAALALLGALSAGCNLEDGSHGGDPPLMLPPDEYGTGQHISSLLGGFYGPAPWVQLANLNSTDCPYPAAATTPYVPVATTGVTVTAVDNWDETGDGAVGSVYVQDTVTPTPIYGATSIFDPSFTPPNLLPLPGDVVDVEGEYEEFIGPSSGYFSQCETLPQLAGAATLRFVGTVPAPVVITPDDLNSYANARRYLNMLVTVTSVTIAGNPTMSEGRYTAACSVSTGSNFALSNQLFNLPAEMPLSENQTFKSVTGIVTYFYDVELSPRSVADFEM